MKYPRTLHLPFSLGATQDDKIAKDITAILNTEVIITEKCDGSNASLEYNGCFARSHSGPPTHPSFDILKSLHASIKFLIPENLQLFGEYLYAKHSIFYDKLPGYFLLFNIRNLNKYEWLSWNDIEFFSDKIGVPTVPILFKGEINSVKNLQELIHEFMIEPSMCGGTKEGVIIRVAESFSDTDFNKKIFKFVRKDHVTSDSHWLHQKIIKNQIKM